MTLCPTSSPPLPVVRSVADDKLVTGLHLPRIDRVSGRVALNTMRAVDWGSQLPAALSPAAVREDSESLQRY